jgi:1-deoxy-D-xylulose-5-phosphate reductoisomerase
MAKAVGKAGATYPAVFNAANEQAVVAFHQGKLPFLGITDVIAAVVDTHTPGAMSLEGVIEAEMWARRRADELIDSSSSSRL